MEYIDGSNLANVLLSHGPFEADAARNGLSQVSSALAAAQVSGIIHRDVRPANILLEHDTDRVLLVCSVIRTAAPA